MTASLFTADIELPFDIRIAFFWPSLLLLWGSGLL